MAAAAGVGFGAMEPAWWIPGAHLQTAWARMARSRKVTAEVSDIRSSADLSPASGERKMPAHSIRNTSP